MGQLVDYRLAHSECHIIEREVLRAPTAPFLGSRVKCFGYHAEVEKE
jgi:hypothetical protein